jgi:tRNA dimethylallyltransferase
LNTESKNSLPAVCLFGPTAVGKTALLRRLLPGRTEVISVDSMQVYRGLDIGTAKPEPRLLVSVPHHLIDIIDPTEEYNVGEFVRLADEAFADILRRGRVPILCGGTAFYFKHFIYGLPPSPPGDKTVREKLERECETRGLDALYHDLRQVDPVTAGRVSPNDRYRITRALEVWRVAGKPLSSFVPPAVPREGYRFLLIGLRRPRDELYRRIECRVREMFEKGLADEFRSMRARGYTADTPGMRGIGYREFFLAARLGCTTAAEVVEMIAGNSRRYAKRQITFFRSIPGVRWYSPEETESIRGEILECIED